MELPAKCNEDKMPRRWSSQFCNGDLLADFRNVGIIATSARADHERASISDGRANVFGATCFTF